MRKVFSVTLRICSLSLCYFEGVDHSFLKGRQVKTTKILHCPLTICSFLKQEIGRVKPWSSPGWLFSWSVSPSPLLFCSFAFSIQGLRVFHCSLELPPGDVQRRRKLIQSSLLLTCKQLSCSDWEELTSWNWQRIQKGGNRSESSSHRDYT